MKTVWAAGSFPCIYIHEVPCTDHVWQDVAVCNSGYEAGGCAHSSGIYGPQRMTPIDSGDPLTFPLAPQ